MLRELMGKLAPIVALAAVACLFGSPMAARAAAQPSTEAMPQAGSGERSSTEKTCPSPQETEMMLRKASALMEQTRYQEAAGSLQSLSGLHCDARVSLLLAAAFEQGGDLPQAEQTLQRAHSAWPSNNSIAASLAREYLGSGQVDKAAQALGHFHVTPTTPMQEMELGVVVFIAGHQLVSAQAVAQAAYRSYPSVHTLLLLANAMQLQGRFKDVVVLLGGKRDTYAGSPAFLITLAESEYDSILYDAARGDLERAISLDQNSYQAHFLLANALFKLGNVDQAISEYRLAIELSPDQPRTYYQLALALQSKQDQAGAEDELAKALSIDGHYAPALIETGRMLISQNRLSDAVTQLNLAIKDNPNAEQAYFLLAKAYSQLGDKEKSDEMAKRLVTARNKNWKSSGNKDESQPVTKQN
jgi:tetratricopeptide (TPR) repeat protein